MFRGYWHNEDATAEAIDADGWFHTGDIGEIDDDGFVRITGRKKELIVTAGGKNVAPAVLEDRVRAHWLVSQCLVVGDQQPFIAALITLDPESLPQLAGARASRRTPMADTRRRPGAARRDPGGGRRREQGGVARPSRSASSRILGADWTEAGGQLTPSLKLKRNVVQKECADEIGALYSRDGQRLTALRPSSRSAKRRGDVPAPALLDPGPAGRAHRARPGRVGEQAGERVGDRVRRARVDHVAGLALAHRVRRAAGVAGDAPAGRWPTPRGTPCRAPRRPARRGGCGTASRTRRRPRSARAARRAAPPGEHDVLGHPGRGDRPAQRRLVRAAADEQQPGVGTGAAPRPAGSARPGPCGHQPGHADDDRRPASP